MAKEFKRKYMHPTRRKLVDMVLHGKEYETNAQISLSVNPEANIVREVGETWTDSAGINWEQTDWGKIQKSSLSDTMTDVRNYLSELGRCKSKKCKTIKKKKKKKKLISKTSFCATCLAIKETQIRIDGLWDAYETYKITSNMIDHGTDVLAQFNQAYNDAKQEYEYVNERGETEKWTMERSVEELKAEILLEITNVEAEVAQVTKLRNEAWELLKNKNYDLVKPPKDLV
jgi:thiol-disulfide isomerase/thioredoxin